MVGLFRPPHDFKPLVACKDLTVKNLERELKGVRTLYTFNGKRFDVPWIAASMGVDVREREDIEHIDLMYVCRRHGLKGGQKNIEVQLELSRHEQGVDGRVAARLGRMWLELRDTAALNRLTRYNREDCVNLWKIREHVAGLERLRDKEDDQ